VGVIDFTLRRTTSAPPEAVFDRLTDHARYKELVPMLRISRVERPGDPPPNGVGAIRRLGVVGPTQVEEVTVYEPPSRFAYELQSGLPVRDHVGTVEIERTPTGTEVTYSVRATPSVPVPGAGFVLGNVLKVGVSGLLDGVIKAAEREG